MGPWAVFAIVMLVINTALMVWSMAQSKDAASPKDATLGEFLFAYTKYGTQIPIVYGWARVGGVIIDQADFSTHKQTESHDTGSMSSDVKTYQYIHRIRQQVAITAGMTDALVWYEIGTQVNTVGWDCGGTMYIDFPESDTKPIRSGRLYWGRDQDIDPILDSLYSHDTHTPAYKGITYAIYHFNLGVMTSPYPTSYIIQRYVNVLDCETTINGDANPAQILYDVIYNGLYGLRYPTNLMNKESFEIAGTVLNTEGHGASLTIGPNEGLDLKGTIETVCDWIDGTIREKNGLLELKLKRFDYDVATIPSVTATDVAKGTMMLQRPGPYGTKNVINFTYKNRDRQGESDSVTYDDLANINATSAVRVAEFDYPIQTTRQLANQVALRLLRQNSYPRANCEFILKNNTLINTLFAYDVFKLTYPRFDIENVVYRLVSKTYLEDKTCKIEALEDFAYTVQTMLERLGGTTPPSERGAITDPNPIAWVGESSYKCLYFIGGKSTFCDLIGFNLSSDSEFLTQTPLFVSDNVIGKTNAIEGVLGATDTSMQLDFYDDSFTLNALGDVAYYQGGYTIMIWSGDGSDLEIMYARSATYIDNGRIEIFPGLIYYYSTGVVSGLLRGQEGTTPRTHPQGSYVAYMQSDCFLRVHPWVTAGSYNITATPVYMTAGYRWVDSANAITVNYNYQDSCNGDIPLPPA
jgi:hypothetical protein